MTAAITCALDLDMAGIFTHAAAKGQRLASRGKDGILRAMAAKKTHR